MCVPPATDENMKYIVNHISEERSENRAVDAKHIPVAALWSASVGFGPRLGPETGG